MDASLFDFLWPWSIQGSQNRLLYHLGIAGIILLILMIMIPILTSKYKSSKKKAYGVVGIIMSIFALLLSWVFWLHENDMWVAYLFIGIIVIIAGYSLISCSAALLSAGLKRIKEKQYQKAESASQQDNQIGEKKYAVKAQTKPSKALLVISTILSFALLLVWIIQIASRNIPAVFRNPFLLCPLFASLAVVIAYSAKKKKWRFYASLVINLIAYGCSIYLLVIAIPKRDRGDFIYYFSNYLQKALHSNSVNHLVYLAISIVAILLFIYLFFVWKHCWAAEKKEKIAQFKRSFTRDKSGYSYLDEYKKTHKL